MTDDAIIKSFNCFVNIADETFFPSSKVDILLFLLNLKPAFRTCIKTDKAYDLFLGWCDSNQFFFRIDHENFCYAAKEKSIVDDLYKIDHSIYAHEIEMGRQLGYPECCCLKIAKMGEIAIDHYESWLSNQDFKGEFRLINPYKYRQGIAFISHVPCSTDCLPSLKIAKSMAQFIDKHASKPFFKSWINEIQRILW